MHLKRKALLLDAIAGCSSWDDIHAKWASFSSEDKGARFEDLTQAFLQVHETYAKDFVNIWRPDEVPAAIAKKLNLRVPEWGIDLVGETRSGEFWSIQCKYLQDTDQELSHKIIASSVATTFQSSRGFSYLLVSTTTQRVTNHYDSNPKVLFYGLPIWQQIDAAFLDTLRNKLAGKKVALTPYSPRKHQINAIQDGLKHFKVGKATRGKLIMPCGTGKSLTAWFLSQALGSKRVVIAVPSLSLVKQTLGVWTREAYHNNVAVDWICVCSDETAGRVEQDDAAIKVKDLGVPCLTSPDEIAKWLKTERKGLTVVFTTYQSGQVLATAARKAKYAFDLGIMDEAHKTVGDGDKLFSHLIHDHNIEIHQRIFMTATERRFSGSSDKILSMDDPEVYGETFHLLTFKKAMEVVEGERPILCDYNVITIGVSRQEVKELIQKNLFVRPDSGKWDEEMEADMLAAMVALRKAMQEYPIKHAVSFHGSIKRAEQFREYNDCFTEEFPSFGELSTFHVSGQTPTGTRSNIIKQFAKADRSLVTNARCLTEGVDVPSIDCVLFADPKKSKVDIVQAVGRALRPAEGKKLGYVILPVLHDEESGDLKESGAFKEVIDMLASLASQDERIIDEFRAISQGRLPAGSSRVSFEFGERISANIDIAQFTGELQIKCWSRLAKLSWRPFEEARRFAQNLGLKSNSQWSDYCQNGLEGKPPLPPDIPKAPWWGYRDSGWLSVGDWLGTGKIADQLRAYRTYIEAQKFVSSLGLKNQRDWNDYCTGKLKHLAPKPSDIPAGPEKTYQNSGWVNLGEWLGTGVIAPRLRVFLSFQKARRIARKLGIKSQGEWREYAAGRLKGFGKLPDDIPACPWTTYKDEGWINLGDWLGTNTTATRYIKYLPFEKARSFVRKLKLKSDKEWKLYMAGKLPQKGTPPSNIPLNANRTYKHSGWISIGDWLGTGKIADQKRVFRSFHEARKFARSLKLKSAKEWMDYSKGRLTKLPRIPDDIPCNPNNTYKESGWVSFGDWVGHDNASRNRKLWSYEKCAAFVRKLKLKSQVEWLDYKRRAAAGEVHLPLEIPRNPQRALKGKGWIDLGQWLGTGNVHPSKIGHLTFEEARRFVHTLNLKSDKEWKAYCKAKISGLKPKPIEIPTDPRTVYKNTGWVDLSDWLGSDYIHHSKRTYLAFNEAREYVRRLGLRSRAEWQAYCKGHIPGLQTKPNNIPANPARTYSDSGWLSVADWLGTKA